MPTLPWSKSNRSHSSVGNASEHSSAAASVNSEAAAQRYPGPPPEASQQQPPPQSQTSPVLPGQNTLPPQAYRQQPAFPSRASSHRHSSNLSLDYSSHPGAQQPADLQHSPGVDGHPPTDQPRRGSYQPQSNTTYVQQEPKKHSSFRSRLVAGFSGGHKDDEPSRSSSHKNGIGRRVSLRKGEAERYQNERLQAQQWAQRQGSSPHLPTNNEEDESDLDPFLQQDDRETPQVPPKDHQFTGQHPQQFLPNHHHQDQYRPPLASVNTEGGYHGQGGVDQYSPEQHPGLQQPQQQQQYQSYSPPVDQQQQNHPHHYQAFNPQASPSPLQAHSQLHPQDIGHSQQGYYYQQQPHQQGQQQQPQSAQGGQQDNSPYQQQQITPPPQQQQGGQDFQLPQPGPPPSQQQPGQPHPQAAHPAPPQVVQQSPQVDTQHLRPPSSQQLVPPSPIQYHAYEAQPGLTPPSQPGQQQPQQQGQQQPQAAEQQAQENNTQTQQSQQQEQSNMAPPAPSASQRNTLRKVNEAGQSGPPTRESSLLQQPQSQGQGQASQGQPYRGGDNKGQQTSSGEMGRATPPPRSVADMSEEEILHLIKDHDVLREKYQKVKRYFFEQQSQVHQLQNTLANQRLSLSRTSWDDSEYSTRFNRLDGLIAQLSFAIRKDWKAIPSWLQVVVNKNAVETGKQEMTAVGRAFISHWIVENIFDKHFHPDLEPGLSTQLKLIQLNIRKLAPLCQSAEDEDALVAKTINWRLATLEGLAEMLRSPQAPANRQTLIESLNQNLIGSLEMFLNEPAPPDLNGGVPMIVELAVNIAQHLPLESREVHIEYYPPGHGLVPDYMKIESGIPALTNPIMDEDDRASLRSVASEFRESVTSTSTEQTADSTGPAGSQPSQPQPSAPAAKEADKGRGMFGFGKSRKAAQPPPQAGLGKRESSLGQSLGSGQGAGSQHSLQQGQQPPGSSAGKDEAPPRVRMAVGVAVQIRGKSILVKAPVYST